MPSTALTLSANVVVQFAVTGAVGSGSGTVVCTSPVDYNTATTCSVNAGANYHITSIATGPNCGNGTTNYSYTAGSGAGGILTVDPFTTGAVTGDCTVTATFEVDSYTITATSGAGGSIACPATATHGSSPDCTITATTGYHVFDLHR